MPMALAPIAITQMSRVPVNNIPSTSTSQSQSQREYTHLSSLKNGVPFQVRTNGPNRKGKGDENMRSKNRFHKTKRHKHRQNRNRTDRINPLDCRKKASHQECETPHPQRNPNQRTRKGHGHGSPSIHGEMSTAVQPPQRVPTKRIQAPEKQKQCDRCGIETSSYQRCDFCHGIYCVENEHPCYDVHDCEESCRCAQCGRRVPKGLTEISAKCHRTYCSPQCLDICWQNHQTEAICAGCKGKPIDDIDEETMAPNPGTVAEKPAKSSQVLPDFDCAGLCNICEEDDCDIRCDDGKCRKCPLSVFETCSIRCVYANDPCKRWRCKGFRCKERWVSGRGCDDDEEECRNCDEEGCYFWLIAHLEDEEE